MSLNAEQERQFIAELEAMGKTLVKSNLDRGKFQPAVVYTASKWLAEKEREEERQREAAQSEQTELMRRASVAAERQALAAERANLRATIALVIAITSMITTIIGILVTHWDTYK
jgi:hypothetical protein